MITTKALVLATFCLGAFSCRLSGAEVFLRPSVWHFDYDAPGFESKFGPALEIGTTLAASGRHAVSMEAARLPWEYNLPVTPGSLLGTVGSGHLTSVLANYRYYFHAPAARWRVFAGASAGATKISGHAKTRLSGVAYDGELDGWSKTFGGTLGVSLAVARNVSIDFAYRYQHWEEMDYRNALFGGTGFPGPTGSKRTFAVTQAHVFTLGMLFKF